MAFRVLVVDDNEICRETLTEYLGKQSGIEVVEPARSGLEALALTQMRSPHLVLLDIKMPGLSGFEVARIIKECYPATRIVFVTFHDEELYREQAQSIDVDGFVCKECLGRNLPSLLKRLRQATQR